MRISTGKTVAVYAGVGKHTTKVLGMFKFLSGAGKVDFGVEFEYLAVMSILAIVEKSGRSMATAAQKTTVGESNWV